MSITIRRVNSDELMPYLATLELAAGRHPEPSNLRDGVVDRAECNRLAAYDGDAIVGGTAFDILELTLPGGTLAPAARIMLTAVLPTHRRQGITTNLMRQQLLDIRRSGLAFAIFTTSGPGIYDRLGYNPTNIAVSLRCRTSGAALRDRPSNLLRLVELKESAATLPRVFDDHRRAQPGQVSRTPTFWEAWFRDRELYRPSGTGKRFVVVAYDSAQQPNGYLCYRLRSGDLREKPVLELVVEDLIAVDDQARLALWNFCLSFEQAPVLTVAHAPSDEPLAWALIDVRSLKVTSVRDFLWLRLVDVPRALGARTYAAAEDLILEVSDPVISSNSGRFRIRTDPSGSAGCEPVKGPADISMDVSALAAVYLGATTFTALARAGRVRPASPEVLRRADFLFWSVPAPWTVMDW